MNYSLPMATMFDMQAIYKTKQLCQERMIRQSTAIPKTKKRPPFFMMFFVICICRLLGWYFPTEYSAQEVLLRFRRTSRREGLLAHGVLP